MKKAILTLLIISTILFAYEDEYIPGEVLIWIDSSYETVCEIDNDGFLVTGVDEVDRLNREIGVVDGKYIIPWNKMGSVHKKKNFYLRNAYKFKLSDKDADIVQICNRYRNLESVKTSDPNHIKPYARRVPNDPRFSSQWHLDQIKAPESWDFTVGDSSVSVCCFESVDWKHPDIGPVLWQNLGEDADGDGHVVERYYDSERGEWSYRFDPGDMNGIDDDSNGYADDFIGYDFIDDLCDYEHIHPEEDCSDYDNDPFDDIGHVGHGTHVSGTMTIASDNGEGVASVGWAPKIACLRTDYTYYQPAYSSWHGAHETMATVAAFAYTNSMGIDVYCLSYGGYSYNGMVATAMQRAWDTCGVVIVAAAGNENTEELSYPASYTHVLGTSATNESDYRAPFSNYGDRIDICAPGVNIWSAMPQHDIIGGDRTIPYEGVDGTSMAAPVVAGVAAVIKSVYPDSSNLFNYLRITEYADPIPDPLYEDRMLGDGRVNLYRSLYQPVFPKFEADSIAIFHDPADEDGRIDIGETGYAVISYSSDPEWQASGDLTLTLSADTNGFDFTTETITLPSIEAGESVNNYSMPLEFTPTSEFGYGKTVKFTFTLESSTGYFRKDTFKILIGYPQVLLYDRDGGELNERFVADDLQRGQIAYDHWDADSLGTIDEDFLLEHYRTVIYINGDNEDTPITEDDIAVFSAFLDDGGGKNFYLSGQYTADSPLITDFIETYFRTEHVLDEVDSRFWGMNVGGVSGDTVSQGMVFNVTMGSDCMGPQYSLGQCRALSGASNSLIYRDHPSYACATRYESAAYKAYFSEFSISGMQGSNPGGNTRYQFLNNLFVWFGMPFFAVEENITSPEKTALSRAYPNPFNSSVNIEFDTPIPTNAEITIFTVDGRAVETIHSGNLTAGKHNFIWKPEQITRSGVYLYSIRTEKETTTDRLLYIK
ncbi:MAG: S8 family serine peptidase [Candidatus Zixiibacteriota bacterium]